MTATTYLYTIVVDDLISEGHTRSVAERMAAILVRTDLTYERKRAWIDAIFGRDGVGYLTPTR
jgi:hypothetical protein